MLFDLGVFMVVVGVTLVILLRLGHLHDANRPHSPTGKPGENA
jgi:hypothetical protein